MSTITDPFQLPEICQRISHYMSKGDLARCSRVCRDWNFSFTPFLWRTIDILAGEYVDFGDLVYTRVPTREAQAKHGQYTKEINLSQYYVSNYLLQLCPNLNSLSIFDTIGLVGPTLALKPRLTKLSLSGNRFLDCAGFWKAASEELKYLRHLRVRYLQIKSDAIDWFWDTCSRLETLELYRVELPKGPNASLLFLDLKVLETSSLEEISRHIPQALFSQCPNLKYLGCPGIRSMISDTMFSFRAVRECWPMLELLDYRDSYISDQDLARILGGMSSIKSLITCTSGFGPLSFATLKPHFHELQEFAASGARSNSPITAAMSQEIMVSCPELLILSLATTSAEELLADRTRWICTKLTFLYLRVEFQDCEPSLHRAMFGQISRLTSLTTLSLEVYNVHHPLDFRLSRGMEQLKGLTRLEEITFNGKIQQMEKEDLQWLWDNMKNFRSFNGNQNPNKTRELQELGEI